MKIQISQTQEESLMQKFFNKWLRKIHRWIAVPTALLIPTKLIIMLIGNPAAVEFWNKWDKIPSIFMLFMAITGAYLYLLPYIVKTQRKQKVLQLKSSINS
jgi:hypothetical protein